MYLLTVGNYKSASRQLQNNGAGMIIVNRVIKIVINNNYNTL